MNDDHISLAGAILRDLECSGVVYEMTLDDEPVWWLMRNHVYNALSKELSASPNSSKLGLRLCQTILRKLVHAFVMFCRALLGLWRSRNIACNPNRILLLLASNDYRTGSCNDSRQDVFLGDVVGRLGRAAVVIDRPTSLRWDINSLVHRNDVVFLDFVFSRAFFYLLMHPRRGFTGWEQVSHEIDDLAGRFSVDTTLVKSVILRQMKKLRFKMHLQLVSGRMLLDIVKPVSILEVTSYDSSVAAVNLAAKRRQVPVIEIQHGVIHSGHVGYSVAVPDDYCLDVMPIPDKILVYGSRFKHCLIEASPVYKDESVGVVGSSRIADFRSKYDSTQRLTRRKAVSGRLGLPNDGFWITITTQRPLAFKMAEFCRNLLGVIPDDVFLCLKLHPDEVGDRSLPYYLLIQDPHVRIVTDHHVDLYELLISSDLHVTGYSTVLLEAMALGIPSFSISFGGSPSASDFFADLNIPTVDGFAELADVIHKLRSDSGWRSSLIAESSKVAEDFYTISIKDPAEAIIDQVLAFACGEGMSADRVVG